MGAVHQAAGAGLTVTAPTAQASVEEGAQRARAKEERMGPSDKAIREGSRWGPMGFLALGAMLLCGGGAYAIGKSGMPAVSVDAPDRWTGTDQIRFETTNNERIGKLERILERMDTLLTTQAQTTNRLLALVEKQDERIKALEEWQRSPRKPVGDR